MLRHYALALSLTPLVCFACVTLLLGCMHLAFPGEAPMSFKPGCFGPYPSLFERHFYASVQAHPLASSTLAILVIGLSVSLLRRSKRSL